MGSGSMNVRMVSFHVGCSESAMFAILLLYEAGAVESCNVALLIKGREREEERKKKRGGKQ